MVAGSRLPRGAGSRGVLGSWLLLLLGACAEPPSRSPPASARAALVPSNLQPITSAQPIGRAQEDQRDVAIAAGAPGEHLLAWRDERNFRQRRVDVYAARVRQGQLVDPLGVPLLSGQLNELEPSLSWDGTQWWLASKRTNDFGEAHFQLSRVAADLSQVTPVTLQSEGYNARVASAPGLTAAAWRHNIGRPRVALFDGQGAPVTFSDAGVVEPFGSDFYAGALALAWSDTHRAFFLLAAFPTSLRLARIDVSDAGVPSLGPSFIVQATSFPSDTFSTSSAELAVAPDGTLGMAWRAGATTWALVTPPLTADLDAGTRLSTASSAAPSVTWTGSTFRVAYGVNANASIVELVDGGLIDTLPIVTSSTECPRCPPLVLEGPLRVNTLSLPGATGLDLDLSLQPEGQSPMSPVPVARSASASHRPSASWNDAGTLVLLSWSEPDDAGVRRHDVFSRLFNPTTGQLGGLARSVGSTTADESNPVAFSAFGRWWLGTTSSVGAYARISSGTGVSNFVEVFSQGSNSPPSFMGTWTGVSNGDRVLFMRLLPDAGVEPASSQSAYTSAFMPSLAVDSSDRPLAVSVSRYGIGDGENARIDVPGGGSFSLSTAAGFRGDSRRAVLASDGQGFVAVYTTRVGESMTLQRRELSFTQDGGLDAGAETELARAPIIETPFVVYARGQYLVLWSERVGVSSPASVRLRTMPVDGGIGGLVPLDIGPGDALEARLAVSPSESSAVVTWLRLSERDAGVPTAWVGMIPIAEGVGASCSSASTCTTGACVDMRCCDQPCNGGCGTCAVDGICRPLPEFASCRPSSATDECRQSTQSTCDGQSLSCTWAVATDGTSCAAGAGECRAGVCVLSDAGVTDAGSMTGGGGGSSGGGGGTTGGGGGGATGGGGAATGGGGGAVSGGGGGADTGGGGGDPAGGGAGADAGVDSRSRYSWNQGCGCSGSSTGAFVPFLVGALLIRRRRRSRGAVLLAATLAVLPLRAFAEPQKAPRLVFSGLTSPSGVPEAEVRGLSDYLQTRIAALGSYDLISSSDIQQLLGLERQRQLLGCSQAECMAELGGALDARRLLSGTIARIGQTMTLNLVLLDAEGGRVVYRAGRRVKGEAVDAAFDLIDGLLLELAEHDPLLQGTPRLPPSSPAVPPERGWSLSVGARLDADFVGIVKEGDPAIAPALSALFQHRVFGAAVAVVIAPTPGVRAELRVAWPGLAVRPYLGAGAVLFGTSFGPRGCLGVLGRLGPVELFLDVGAEGFLTGPDVFHRLALLAGGGAAFAF